MFEERPTGASNIHQATKRTRDTGRLFHVPDMLVLTMNAKHPGIPKVPRSRRLHYSIHMRTALPIFTLAAVFAACASGSGRGEPENAYDEGTPPTKTDEGVVLFGGATPNEDDPENDSPPPDSGWDSAETPAPHASKLADDALSMARSAYLQGDYRECLEILVDPPETSAIVGVSLLCHEKRGNVHAACRLAERHAAKMANAKQFHETRCR